MPEGVLLDAAADLVDGGGAELDDVERVQHGRGVFELVVDRGLVAGERVKSRDLHVLPERFAASGEPGRVGLPGAAGHEVEQPGPRLPGAVAAEIDHPGQLLRAALSGVDVMPDVLIDAEGGDVLEPGLVLSQFDQLGLDGPPHRLPRRSELTGDTVHGGVLAAQLPDRPADGARGDRPAPGHQTRELLHERPSHASHLVAPARPAAATRSAPASRRAHHEAPVGDVRGRSRRPRTTGSRSVPPGSRRSRSAARHGGQRPRHGPHRGRAASRSGNTGRRQSTRQRTPNYRETRRGPRLEQQLALLILGDLDPYPPNPTRRASPPPNVRRADYPRSRHETEAPNHATRPGFMQQPPCSGEIQPGCRRASMPLLHEDSLRDQATLVHEFRAEWLATSSLR